MSDEELDRIANPVTRGVSSVETLRAVPRLVAALRADREELARLRSIFANDMLDESVVARGAYEQGRKDFEREVCEALAVLPEMLEGEAARIDWHHVRARLKPEAIPASFRELLERLHLTKPKRDQRRSDWSAGWSLLWAVEFVPGEELQSGQPLTVGPDGLWRRARSGDMVYGHVQIDGEGVARVRGVVPQNSIP